MRVIGLTGGIAMGKSTVAGVFRRAGVPVFDADGVVHRLQGLGGAAVRGIGEAFPGVVREGRLDRAALRARVIGNEAAMRRLEGIVHPLVRAEERRFVARARRAGRRCVVLDIPLLFETGGERRVDFVVTVSAPAAIQAMRLRSRRGMTPEQAARIVARQVPDRDKRRRARYVIRTGLSRHQAQRQVRRLIAGLR